MGIFLLLFCLGFLTDVLYARGVISMAGRKCVQATVWNTALGFVNLCSLWTIIKLDDIWNAVVYLAGGAIGTYVVTKRWTRKT